MKLKHYPVLFIVLLATIVQAQNPDNSWQKPDKEIMDVLNAPQLPWVYTSPKGDYLLMMDPVAYPPLADLAAPMHKLAGLRVNPKVNDRHGSYGGTSPRIMDIASGKITPINIPANTEVVGVTISTDGKRFALSLKHEDRIGLWTGSTDGTVKEVKDVALNPLMGGAVVWTPDQKKLLIRKIPKRGAAPAPPAIPVGPKIVEGDGASARSTYEARNLLETAHDDQLFEYYTTCELILLDPETGQTEQIGKPAIYAGASFSPDGKYILVSRLKKPWSHEVAYWRFAKDTEVWNTKGELVKTIHASPLEDAIPVHGVPTGPRSISWRPTAPSTLIWVEALDGGDPAATADHRDKLMMQEAPFTSNAKEVFKAQHRIQMWRNAWFANSGQLMLSERERMKRWRYVWLIDVDNGTSRKWYDLNEADRYNDPGSPMMKRLDNGFYVLRENKGGIYFRGSGGTNQGDRPFLDIRNVKTGNTERLFRCDPEKYQTFTSFIGDEEKFIMRSESSTEVPNYYMCSFGKKIKAEEGEATRELKMEEVTKFEDPTPQLRQIEKRIVRYERKDGVPLSFQLHLPPGYKEGTKLPTVVYAYPLEYASAEVAGQVRGSTRRFMRIYGPSHMFFLLKGYAVLHATTMPMIGDPETTYNTFVQQLNDDAEAAVNKIVEMGIADPDKIGIIGHSHGGLMVANLLAHTDLFKAGIARSGSYNKTNQPFGFQSERRSLFEARDVYIQVSPTFFADKVNEPVLIIHGDDDSNPGTLTFQSEVFYEAVRGSGGTARMVLLPYEDHGYRARESIEHVLWEQLRWFDKYLKE